MPPMTDGSKIKPMSNRVKLSFSAGKVNEVIIFIIAQLWLTSHPRSTAVLLDTRTPGTSREIYSEDADHGTRTRSLSVINRVLQPLS